MSATMLPPITTPSSGARPAPVAPASTDPIGILADETPPWKISRHSLDVEAFSSVVAGYEPITLRRAKDVALLRRVDTKYVLGASQLLGALEYLAGDYSVLDVSGVRLQRYRTLYFDTPGFDLYLRHHRGHADRYKVRSRSYVDSDLSFLEVKHKSNKDWTTKRRIRSDGMITRLTPGAWALLGEWCPFATEPLRPTVENDFRRITLVSKRNPERVTLDLCVEFSCERRRAALPGLAIAEVKQDGLNRSSAFFQAMRAAGVRPTGISKYCVGVALLCETVKHNNFKPKLRLIEKVIGEDHVRRDS